ncbi:hypothetical protein [Pontiella agarivorans]|uniref:Uncharacterized protein n=1 Tax=Pontiella agarivorans TaxID=3038953 RepID=A0ABU5N1U7_9BACT|nr:hypothetical protein [Pontiella agarivorans]MDZ8120368.1 hypothetical protein [Pontiella agarivorans]
MKVLRMILMLVVAAGAAVGEENVIELTASKDVFFRSNHRTKNNGASKALLLAGMPGVTTLVGFDLSGVTNEIESAEFYFQILEDSDTPLSLTIATMALGESNGLWVEGGGDLGLQGRNAKVGESTFQWRSFRDEDWVDANGRSVKNLLDSRLWNEVKQISDVEWEAERRVGITVDRAQLEEVRNMEVPVITFGLWGTKGNGVYKIGSKESDQPARLMLKVIPSEAF